MRPAPDEQTETASFREYCSVPKLAVLRHSVLMTGVSLFWDCCPCLNPLILIFGSGALCATQPNAVDPSHTKPKGVMRVSPEPFSWNPVLPGPAAVGNVPFNPVVEVVAVFADEALERVEKGTHHPIGVRCRQVPKLAVWPR